MWPVVLLLAAIALGGYLLWRWLRTPTPSPIGPGGVITRPGYPGTVVPFGAQVSFLPPTINGPVTGAGIRIKVEVRSMTMQPVDGVQVVAAITTGQDAAITSYIDLNITLSSGVMLVGTELRTATGTNGYVSFTLTGTADGDEDVLTIVVGTGTSTETKVYRYSTRP